MRVGTGYDVHRLKEGCRLILGGVDIPFEKGLSGHSDADVLCHAIVDAILGAAGLGDIGKWFPDTDPKWKNHSSLDFLRHCKQMIEKKYSIINIDSTVMAQNPKIKPFVAQMITNISAALGIKKSLVSIKATTTEGLGFEGRGEGIGAQAIVLLQEIE